MPSASAKAALGGEVVKSTEHPADQPEASLEQKVATAAGQVDLVNESAVGRLQAQNAALLEELSVSKRQLAKEQERANALEMKVQKGGFSDESRIFRLYLAIIEGFVARGVLDPSALAEQKKKNPNASPEQSYILHAAGLAQVANLIARDKQF